MKTLHSTESDFETAMAALLDDQRQPMAQVAGAVAEIIDAVRVQGDAALFDFTERFDRHRPAALRLTDAEIAAAADQVPADLMAALQLAADRIAAFHLAQLPADLTMTDDTGISMGLRWRPIDAVGLYVPGGKAAYPSSVLMNAMPAKAAGVARIAMCVPCPDGVMNPLVLAAARLAGVTEIYRIGGAQAVAALAYGTASIQPVDRIVGPGNAFVAEAKRQVFGKVGIDSIAGPSEVVVIADAANNPAHIAMDLLAQAEHDETAQSILITPDTGLAQAVAQEVDHALQTLPRAAIAGASWRDHGRIIVVRDLAEACAISNRLAPEHLQLMVADPAALFAQIRHAGAVFLGRYCPEAVGDYIAGPNHVLPTGRSARFASGLSVFDFVKRTSWVDASRESLAKIGPAAVALAKAEGLHAHARSIALRL